MLLPQIVGRKLAKVDFLLARGGERGVSDTFRRVCTCDLRQRRPGQGARSCRSVPQRPARSDRAGWGYRLDLSGRWVGAGRHGRGTGWLRGQQVSARRPTVSASRSSPAHLCPVPLIVAVVSLAHQRIIFPVHRGMWVGDDGIGRRGSRWSLASARLLCAAGIHSLAAFPSASS